MRAHLSVYNDNLHIQEPLLKASSKHSFLFDEIFFFLNHMAKKIENHNAWV